MFRRVAVLGAIVASLTTLGLGTGVAAAAPTVATPTEAAETTLAQDPRNCGQAFRDTVGLALTGAGAGALAGPWGAVAGTVVGFAAGAWGGCTRVVPGHGSPAE